MATNVRFLEQAGLSRPMAIGAVGVNSVAGLAVHVTAIFVVLPWLGVRGVLHVPATDIADRWPWACSVLVTTVLTIGVAARRRVWAGAVGPARIVLAAAGASIRTPRSAAALLLGSAGVTAAYALALAASVQAVGGGVGPVQVVTVYLGASAVAAASPTPGGLGTLEAALVAGLISFGAAAHVALAAVVIYRVITYWLPVLPGWVAFRWLRANNAL
jgi:undecaprenyl-diphosphatase